jgi:hypothetical protein
MMVFVSVNLLTNFDRIQNTLDPDSSKYLDPDPESVNTGTDPKHCGQDLKFTKIRANRLFPNKFNRYPVSFKNSKSKSSDLQLLKPT